MQEGAFRCDANVSVRPRGQPTLGTRAEIKNLNSFRYLERAIQYEAQRQIDLIEDGHSVVQETRLYDADRDQTRSMRSKEDAQDYRYFPDPDLPPLRITPDWIEAVRTTLPELPEAKRTRLKTTYGLSSYDAAQLTSSRDIADYFEAVVKNLPAGQTKQAANWIMGELAAALNRDEISITQSPVAASTLSLLITRILDGTISNKIAREVFTAMWAHEEGGQPDAIIEARGLKQMNDSTALVDIINHTLATYPDIVKEYQAGKQKAFNALVGHIMKAAKGKANPQQVHDLLKQKLSV
jgi:aspartyl-tRNA(Asn)/glutamyl-tRNA(Gln) amidotransferase subunit B